MSSTYDSDSDISLEMSEDSQNTLESENEKQETKIQKQQDQQPIQQLEHMDTQEQNQEKQNDKEAETQTKKEVQTQVQTNIKGNDNQKKIFDDKQNKNSKQIKSRSDKQQRNYKNSNHQQGFNQQRHNLGARQQDFIRQPQIPPPNYIQPQPIHPLPQPRGNSMAYGQFIERPAHLPLHMTAQQFNENNFGSNHIHGLLKMGQYGEERRVRELSNLKESRRNNHSEDLFPLERPKNKKASDKIQDSGKLYEVDMPSSKYESQKVSRQELQDRAKEIKLRKERKRQEEEEQFKRELEKHKKLYKYKVSSAIEEMINDQNTQDRYQVINNQTNLDYLDDEKFEKRKKQRHQLKQQEAVPIAMKQKDKNASQDMEFPSIFHVTENESQQLEFPSIFISSESQEANLTNDKDKQINRMQKLQSKVLGTLKDQKDQPPQIQVQDPSNSKDKNSKQDQASNYLQQIKLEYANLMKQITQMKNSTVDERMEVIGVAKQLMSQIEAAQKKEKERQNAEQSKTPAKEGTSPQQEQKNLKLDKSTDKVNEKAKDINISLISNNGINVNQLQKNQEKVHIKQIRKESLSDDDQTLTQDKDLKSQQQIYISKGKNKDIKEDSYTDGKDRHSNHKSKGKVSLNKEKSNFKKEFINQNERKDQQPVIRTQKIEKLKQDESRVRQIQQNLNGSISEKSVESDQNSDSEQNFKAYKKSLERVNKSNSKKNKILVNKTKAKTKEAINQEKSFDSDNQYDKIDHTQNKRSNRQQKQESQDKSNSDKKRRQLLDQKDALSPQEDNTNLQSGQKQKQQQIENGKQKSTSNQGKIKAEVKAKVDNDPDLSKQQKNKVYNDTLQAVATQSKNEKVSKQAISQIFKKYKDNELPSQQAKENKLKKKYELENIPKSIEQLQQYDKLKQQDSNSTKQQVKQKIKSMVKQDLSDEENTNKDTRKEKAIRQSIEQEKVKPNNKSETLKERQSKELEQKDLHGQNSQIIKKSSLKSGKHKFDEFDTSDSESPNAKKSKLVHQVQKSQKRKSSEQDLKYGKLLEQGSRRFGSDDNYGRLRYEDSFNQKRVKYENDQFLEKSGKDQSSGPRTQLVEVPYQNIKDSKVKALRETLHQDVLNDKKKVEKKSSVFSRINFGNR